MERLAPGDWPGVGDPDGVGRLAVVGAGGTLLQGVGQVKDAGNVDRLIFDGIHELRIDLGDGDDGLELNNLRLHGRVGISAGAGDDRLLLRGTCRDAVTIHAGDANDRITISRFESNGLSIRGGFGKDRVYADRTLIRGLAEVCDTSGSLIEGRLNAFDAVSYMRTYHGGSNPADRTVLGDWRGAAHNDDILVRANGVTGNAEVWRNEGGTWNRVTTVANSTTKRINIFSMRWNDTVTIENGVVARVYAYGGGGTDLLRGKVGSSSASAAVFLYGGAHNDTLIGSDYNDYMSGQGGHDVLTGNLGADIVLGDAGDDILNLIDSVADGYNGGSGTNTINKDGIDYIYT